MNNSPEIAIHRGLKLPSMKLNYLNYIRGQINKHDAGITGSSSRQIELKLMSFKQVYKSGLVIVHCIDQ